MNIEQARINMIKSQVKTWDVDDPVVLKILQHTPREDFVPPRYRQLAFADFSIPLGHNQHMMSPKEEAKTLQAFRVISSDKVLEIGTGSGYMTALLAQQAKHVYSVEIFSDFTEHAAKKLAGRGLNNVTFITGDGAKGWLPFAPYDVIVITGSLPWLPPEVKESLQVGGRLFAILGEAPAMEATLIVRVDEQQWVEKKLFETVVSPLLNTSPRNAFVF